jgi:hypothetical protein
MQELTMSKGSRSRPFSVSQKQFGNNYDAIFGKKDRRVIEDAQAEDEAFKLVDKANKNNYNTSTETDK